MQSTGRTSAGIVIYHPEWDHLRQLVSKLAPDVRSVVIYANSAVPAAEERALAEVARPAGLAIVRPQDNLGLGAAYNALVDGARTGGDDFLLLFDQDSLPEAGSVRRLVDISRALASAGRRPAIVGPRPYGPDGRPMKIARRPADETPPGQRATRADFVISSGSLLDLAAAEAVGPFRADYFIDAIDLEWCFRANARGFSIWIADEVRMDHRLGRGVLRLPLGLRLADQPPRRLYTFVRNQLSMLRLGHVPTRHKVKTVAALPVRAAIYLVRNRFSAECRAALRNGVVDGLRDRLGPPDRAFRRLGAARRTRTPESKV